MSALNNFKLKTLLGHLWKDYTAMTPLAEEIREILSERNEVFVNDHIALRTFNIDSIGVRDLARPFLSLGYQFTGEYHFEKKKLYARSYSHMSGNFPRVFISELLIEEFSEELQSTVRGLVEQLPNNTNPLQLLQCQSLWPQISFEEYSNLLEESEYAAWLAAFGIRANHFTVSVNALRSFGNLQSLNAFLRSRGYRLNGGEREIQGSPELFLEQSSTVANEIPWEFEGGLIRDIPSCYYEFAIRYPVPGTWKLYDGFISQSADKIFESTNVGHFERVAS
jgi:hypothetical protein